MFNQGQMGRIASKLGYQGPMHKFNEFLASNPGAQSAYAGLENKAKMMKMSRGGAVRKFQVGGFNAQAYLTSNPDVAQAGVDPYQHYLQYGQYEGRSPTGGRMEAVTTPAPTAVAQTGFNAQAYSQANPDVAESGMDPYTHYVQYGIYEGRGPAGGTATSSASASPSSAPVSASTATNAANRSVYFNPGQMNTPMTATATSPNQNIVQSSEGVGAPTVGAAVPQMTPYGPVLDESGNPIQRQVLDVEGNPVLDASGNAMYEAVYPTIADYSATQMFQPGLPPGAQQLAQGVEFGTQQAVSPAGTQVGTAPTVSAPDTATTAQATAPITPTAQQYQAMLASGQVPATAPAIGTVSAPAVAQSTVPSSTEVAEQQAAQIDSAVRVTAPDARTLSAEELVTAPADAQFATQFAEQVQAAQAQPTEQATVQGQLANLMADFEDGQTPAWAAGAMRNATAIMAQRGLGASSMAGQAIIQAAMESALPIAVQDAQTMSQFEQLNLSNRQARAMLAAQQRAQFIGQEFDQTFQARVQNASRISDIANMNFNAEQQIALENARMAQTVDLNNLTNRQAVQMANIAQISQLELTNLNNRQQAAVQNAQSFLQMDMANLSNDQQAIMFDSQSKVQALLSDQAAENASRQFNATSENQTNQFFANLTSQVSQFNATQSNAMEQFNIEQGTAVKKFNSELQNQRDQFNAQNQLVIAQSNAQWRREIATANTAAINEANAFNAQAVLGVSEQAYANLWQAYEDEMEYAWQGGQNELDRINKLAQQRILADAELSAADAAADASTSSALGSFAATALFGTGGSAGFLTKFMQ
jgi:hypothetical protein